MPGKWSQKINTRSLPWVTPVMFKQAGPAYLLTATLSEMTWLKTYRACFVFELAWLVTGIPIQLTAQVVLFDFENAPIRSPLPVSLTVDGITAKFKATGQGFSIQPANTMGFTPANFGGLCIYPSSIYLADLVVKFDSTLVDFSMLYACQELGCDDAATMRVTAYLKGAYVGTNTKTASQPGTWPSDILRCSFLQGFDSVVIHYDKKPPTCQDYGVIFMADNMRVTTAATLFIPLCQGETTTTLDANIFGTKYQWQIATTGSFTNITNNSNYSGATTSTLTLSNMQTSWATNKYRCLVDGGYTNTVQFQFANAWVGTVDTIWEKPANWSCGLVPDANTDVTVEAGTTSFPTVRVNTSCRSLNVKPGAVVNIKPGVTLLVTGK
jgi:hypothetical protein